MRSRIHFITLLLCLICSGAFAQQNADSVIRKNKIKQVYIYEGKRAAGTQMYDEDGHLIFEFSNNMYGPATSTTKRGYKNGRLEWEKSKISTMKDTLFTVYIYDKAGNLTQTENGYAAKVTSAYEYDSANRKTRELVFNEEDPGTRDIVYKYNKQGNLGEMLVNDKWARNMRTLYIYDKNNRLIKREVSDNGGPKYTEELEYDESGHEIKETHTKKEANTDIRFMYDKSGHVVQVTESDVENGKETVTHTVKYTYNDYGLLNSWEDSDMPGKVFTYKYETW